MAIRRPGFIFLLILIEGIYLPSFGYRDLSSFPYLQGLFSQIMRLIQSTFLFQDNDKNDSQNIELPCEFCEKMIPLKILNQHQEHCSYGNRLFNFNHSVEEQKVECNYCGQQCKLSVIEAHEVIF